MKTGRAGFVVASCAIASVIVASPLRLESQTPGNGPNGPGQGKPGKVPGTVAMVPFDQGRPWGWATRAFMENPDRELYNTTKRKLFEGKQVFSQTITKLDVEGYCKGAAQYDFSRFEMQHTTMTFGDVEKMIAACPRVAATPILRVPDATETMVQHAVDLGVLGIIIPTVDDALESRQAAMFARFPPTGRRSTGGGQAGSIWGPIIPKPQTFRDTINDNMLVTVMIETLEGVKNALEIASQPGVDVVIIGNADFESFSGFGPTSAGYLDLQTRVRNATYLAGKFWGNANPGFSTGNPLAPDSRYHLGVPPGKGPAGPVY
ncbi:MAG: aldolase/citrate lyase family protein [Vicinamibacterales bacterium]|nr:aldolase/citrate lyase family protein [Vicinamibacterales bacterium]